MAEPEPYIHNPYAAEDESVSEFMFERDVTSPPPVSDALGNVTSEVGVLIPSCDAFADVWEPCLTCINRNWPLRPWPIYTISNRLDFGSGRCVNIKTGDDLGWAANLKFALEQIPSTYVLMWLDDMLLDHPVFEARVYQALELMRNDLSWGGVRLGSGPEDVHPSTNSKRSEQVFVQIKQESQYRISTSPTLWRVSYLKQILEKDCVPPIKNAWDFELVGTVIARKFPDRIAKCKSETPAIQVQYTAITRGEWEPGALRYLDSQGITVNITRKVRGYDSAEQYRIAEAERAAR